MKRRRFVLAALAVLACAWWPVQAAPRASAAQPLAIGDTFTLDSKALGETRRINVWRPSAELAAPGVAKRVRS